MGFLHGIEHEMRHKNVIHHRYTMVWGVDPEPAFPEDLTATWVRRELLRMLVTVVTLGIPDFFKAMRALVQRTRGRLHPMIQAQCSDKDLRFIQRESFAILAINAAALSGFAVLGRWDLIIITMLGPEIGHAIGAFYHKTEHIAMMYNSKDQQLCTRGVKVSPITRFFCGGLDEHVEHHMFPGVPSRNLARLREAMDVPVPERKNVIACWKEIYAIAKHREAHPDAVFVPPGIRV